jgi:hypothetical protein
MVAIGCNVVAILKFATPFGQEGQSACCTVPCFTGELRETLFRLRE